MAIILGIVYSPPKAGLPHLLMYKNDVLGARPCTSVAQGDAFLAKIMPELQAKIAGDKKKEKAKAARKKS